MCEHTQTVLYSAGSMTMYGGEVSDTLQDVEVCLQCGQHLPDPQIETTDRFVLLLRLSKAEREWDSVTNRIYDEPNREIIGLLDKRANDLLAEIDRLNDRIDNLSKGEMI